MTQKKPQWAVVVRQGRTERILFSLLPVLFIWGQAARTLRSSDTQGTSDARPYGTLIPEPSTTYDL